MTVLRPAGVAAMILLATACADDGDGEADDVWQVGTISSLSAGGYDGTHAVSEVADHGDFGLGTYDGLDGEMVIVDDVIYQVRADGSVVEADEGLSTPFAQVTTFEADERIEVDEPLACEDLPATVESVVNDDAALVALRIEGQLSMLQTRSVPRQQAPYDPLADVVAEQQVTFDLGAVEAVLVGFRSPAQVESLSPPGIHLHSVTSDRRAGGHVLACELLDATIELDVASGLTLDLEPTAD